METKIIKSLLLIAAAITTLSFVVIKEKGNSFYSTSAYPMPKGWHNRGSDSLKYDMGIDNSVNYKRQMAATIKSKEKKIEGFGTFRVFLPKGFDKLEI